MKKQILALSLGLMTIGSFAQKKQINSAEKALKNGNFDAAATAIKSAESLIADASDKYKSKFYFIKGQVMSGVKDYKAAADAFNKLIAFDQKVGKDRYASKAQPMLAGLINNASNEATDLYNNKKDYKAAAEKFYLISQLSPRDTVFMFNAALSAAQGKDYASAIKYYEQLRELGFTDIKTQYVATNKKTGKIDKFPSQTQRDLMVKSGEYIKPEIKTSKSKKSAIVKDLAIMYKKTDQGDKAISLFEEARKADPADVDLLISQAYMYNDLGQPEKFEPLIQEAISKDPTNTKLVFDIGLVNYNQRNGDEAIKYFKKVLEMDPDFKNGNLMLANSMLINDAKLVEKMNDLPPSDMNGYTRLENERKELLNSVIPVLLKADKQERTLDTVSLLKSIYQLIENDAKASEYKAIEDSMKQ